MKFIYPPIKNLSTSPNVKSLTFDDIYTDSTFSNELGSYIIGKNKTFHGGINLTVPKGYAVQAVADGRIIAYRMGSSYQKIETEENGKKLQVEFSNCFILIEHDFDQFEYIKFPSGTIITNPYEGYKFYSLYMHLMPEDDVNNQVKLPDWLVLDKKKNELIPRGEEIVPKVPNFNKGFANVSVLVKQNNSTTNKSIKISERDVVEIDGKYYTNKPLQWYDNQNATQVAILDKFKNASIVTLSDSDAIPVTAGEIIGYAGKSQGKELFDTQSDAIHFEIWISDKTFIEYNSMLNEHCAYAPKGSSLEADKLKVISNLDQRSLGYSYLKLPARNVELEFFSFDDEDPSGILNVMIRKKGNYAKISDTVAKFQTGLNITSVLTLYTDADWTKKPVDAWQIIKQEDFFNADGSIKEAEVKIIIANNIDWVKKQKHSLVKLSYSEWDKRSFDAKYAFLLNPSSQLYTKLSQERFNELKKYQEAVSFLDQIEGMNLVPKLSSLHVAHPIEFLKVMQRCVLPAPPSANTHLIKRIIQYSLDESVALVQKIVDRLQQWINGTVDTKLDSLFRDYFGFARGQPNVATASNIVFTSARPAVVTDFNIACKIVLEHFKNAFRILKNTSYDKLCYGWGIESGAYVYPNDLNCNIHLGYELFRSTSVVNYPGISKDEVFSVPSMGRSFGELGVVSSIVHEAMHFIIKNTDITDNNILSNMYSFDANHKYTNDISVSYKDRFGSTIDFQAYGDSECIDLAKEIPYATLVNADSYANFFASLYTNIIHRPVLNYRGI
nr:hypothetical protein [Acinetobacter sp. Marseille-Q1620]